MIFGNEPRQESNVPSGQNPGSAGGEREERLQVEQSLHHSEEIFRLLVEGVSDYAIFMLDPAGHVATWNLGAERIKGYSAPEILGRHLSTFYPQEQIDRGWPEHELKVAASQGRFEDEGWRVRKDGSLFWANVIITAIYQDGTLRGFSKVTRDLTERRKAEESLRQARDLLEKRVEERTAELTQANETLRREIEDRKAAEQALQASEQRLRSLMELMPVGVYMCEAPSGILQYFNRCAAELWGRQPEIGTPEERFCGSHRLFWPDGTPLAHHSTPMAQVLGGGAPVRGKKVLMERPDGTRITALVNIDPVTSETGEVIGAINVFQDVTERERLFEELRHSEERFRRLLYALPAAIYTTDREGRITLYNDHAAEMWGRKPEVGKEMWCGSFRIFHPDGTPLPHDECPMAITLREGRGIRGQEIVVERPDGNRAHVLPYPEPLFGPEGEINGAVNMLVDITDRKQTEEELRKRAEQIERMAQELAAADRRKNEFLATLAHELRNPLAPINNALNLLHLKTDRSVQDQARDMIERQIRQMVRLIDDLLEVSRITSNKLHLRKARVELATAIGAALETSGPLIEEAGHQLSVTLPTESIYLDADLTRLAQVFTNLLNNATKYTEKGGHIWLTAEKRDSDVVVSVRDTGIGFAGEHLPHLFEMFSQAAPALDRSQGGLGVGLALARGVVELHGGRIEARSEGPGKGSEFIVRLPVVDPPEQKQSDVPLHQEEPSGSPRYRVLIADDNPDAAESLGLLLDFAGYQVCVTHDGFEAIRAAETFLPDVALLDLGMPGMNGFEVATRMREQPWGAKMTLIALTGWGQEEDKQRSAKAGFDYHLVKPTSITEIKALLASLEH